jgi:hypothetical protein
MALIGCAAILSACGTGQLPSASAPAAKSHDCTVMSAVLREFVRPRYETSIRLGLRELARHVIAPRYLLGSTLVVCGDERQRRAVGGCITPDWLALAEHLGPETTWAVHAQLNSSMRIVCRFEDDVFYLPAGTERLQRSHYEKHWPAPVTVIALSAPAYLTERDAVVAYRRVHASGGFVRLRLSAFGWWVQGHSSWFE